MCYRIVTMAVLPLLLKRFGNLGAAFTTQEIKGGRGLPPIALPPYVRYTESPVSQASQLPH
ncbi:hypothetical protein PspCFBP13528_13965 [Pseudomonas sp. CFBP13528]|nr:hypothetical protein PspCFBP13528_13965 [Pseudomonas sp. CFBP13528]